MNPVQLEYLLRVESDLQQANAEIERLNRHLVYYREMNDKEKALRKALLMAIRGIEHGLTYAEMPKDSRNYLTEQLNFAKGVNALLYSPDTLTESQKKHTIARFHVLAVE